MSATALSSNVDLRTNKQLSIIEVWLIAWLTLSVVWELASGRPPELCNIVTMRVVW